MYQVGGSLRKDAQSYIVRKADGQLYEALKQGEFCYVLNCRQMGKSSLLVRTQEKLRQQGEICVALDMTSIGSENITVEQWYRGVIVDLYRSLRLTGKLNLKQWFLEKANLSPLKQLGEFIETIITDFFPDRLIIIFIDEIDSILSLPFAIDDFFALIRYCYNQRALNAHYNRLVFALFGVATPSDLIQDRQRTPFNIGRAVEVNGFTLEESQQFMEGLPPQLGNRAKILERVIYWTNGQPFLTQKLCQLITDLAEQAVDHPLWIPPGHENYWIDQIVQDNVIQFWESQDNPEHFRTIRDRLCFNTPQTGRLLGIYQQLLQGIIINQDDSQEQTILRLSGLVIQHQGLLKIKNRLYEQIFNLAWVNQQLALLRPYSQAFNAWIHSQKSDRSRLLRGQALQDAKQWAKGKSLDNFDYQFLSESEEIDHQENQRKLELERARAIEIQLEEKQKRLLQEQRNNQLQRSLLVLLSTALLLVSGLGFFAFLQYRQAKVSETEALIDSSGGLFTSNNQIGAMVAAIKAQVSLKKLRQLFYNDPILNSQADVALRQTVYGNNETNRLIGHKGGVLSVAASPDNQFWATASNDKTAKIWYQDGRLAHTLPHSATVHRVAFSSDSRQLVTGTLDGYLWLWNTQGKLLRKIKAHQAPIWGVAFSPDNQAIASASGDGTAKLWSVDGPLQHTLKSTDAVVWSVAFSQDGQRIATGLIDGKLQIWSRDGQLLHTWQKHRNAVWDVAYCTQQNLWVSASSDKTAKVWKPDGEIVATLKHGSNVLGVDCQGDFIATSSKDNLVKIWKLDGSFIRNLPGHRSVIRDVAFSQNGRKLISGSDDGTAKIWGRNQYLLKPLYGGVDTLWSSATSPDGRFLATVGGNALLLYDRSGNRVSNVVLSFQRLSGGLSFSADSRFLMAVSNRGALWVWDLRSPQLLRSALSFPKKTGGMALTSSPDGRKIATAGDSQDIQIYSLDWQLLARIPNLPDRIWALSYSADSKILASASEDGTVKLWNEQGKLLKTLNHGGAVWGVAISPTESLIASSSRDNTLKLWNFDGQLLKTIPGQSNGLTRVAFSPDGQTIATGGIDRTVKLWSREGKLLKSLPGHRGSVISLAFTADGKSLLSGGDDALGILWDLTKINQVQELNYACDWLKDYLAYSQDVNPDDRPLCQDVR